MSRPTEVTPRGFWVGLALGVLLMAWGVRLFLEATPDLERRVDLVAWLVGLDLAHDLLLAPAVVGVGYLVSRAVPGWARAAVQVALILTAMVVLVGLLPLLGTFAGDNPTIQPLDYGPSIAAVIVAVWVTAALALLIRGRSRSASQREQPETGSG